MTKEATAAVASVLMLLALFAFAQLDSTRGFAFRRSHTTPANTSATPASAPTLTNAESPTAAETTACEPSPEH